MIPNPIHPGDILHFNLPRESEIVIYTRRGQRVATISSNTWDGRDEKGQWVASGIYLAQITTPTGEKKQWKVAVVK
jgi:hypothetical protein